MDFSTIKKQKEIKYIQSPVVYKFPSEKFINKKSPSSINAIGSMLFEKQHQNTSQKPSLQLISLNHMQNEQNKSQISQDKKNQDMQYEIHIIPETKDSALNAEPIYSKFYKTYQDTKQTKLQTEILHRRSNNWQRRSSQDFPYYHKYFSPDNLKSSNLPSSAFPYNDSQRYSLPRKSLNEQLTRYAANEVIHQTEKQLLQKQISTLKLQLKTYEQKVQQLNQYKEEWTRCKNRNEILQREYKILNENFIRLKDSQLENIEDKWKTSEVKKIDLNYISSQDFGKKVLMDKRRSYEMKGIIDGVSQFKEEQIKELNEKVQKLQNEVSNLKRENLLLSEENRKKRSSLLINQSVNNINKQAHKLEEQIVLLKQQNFKLQQQKQSYVSNYKILKNEREKECKQLKINQEEIYQSLQKLNKDFTHIKQEKEQIQAENRKLKRKNMELENEIQVLSKKYSTMKIDYDQVNNTQYEQFYKIKNHRTSFQDKCQQLQDELQSANQAHTKKLQQIHKEKNQQKDNLVKKYQQKINSLQNQIIDLKDRIFQNHQELKNYEKEIKNYKREINQNESKIEKYEKKIIQLEQRIKQNEVKAKQYSVKMKEQYEEKMRKDKVQYQEKLATTQKTIRNHQQKIIKLEGLLDNKQEEMKQKQKEFNETILAHSNQRESLKSQSLSIRQKLTQKQAELSAAIKQHSLQLNNFNLTLLAYQQRQVQQSSVHHAAIIMNENEIKKQRLQIEALLQQIVKLRQVKNQNYKLIQKQKTLVKINQTINHLWAVKQTEYQNIAQILTAMNCGQITTNK